MSAFLNVNKHLEQNSGEVKGQTFDIACLSWCNAKKKISPVLFKYIGEDECVYTVRDIGIKAYWDKNYSGFPCKEYDCEAVVGGFLRDFKLIYFINESRWVMKI